MSGFLENVAGESAKFAESGGRFLRDRSAKNAVDFGGSTGGLYGAGAGFLIGGPVGALIGAGLGTLVGAGTTRVGLAIRSSLTGEKFFD